MRDAFVHVDVHEMPDAGCGIQDAASAKEMHDMNQRGRGFWMWPRFRPRTVRALKAQPQRRVGAVEYCRRTVPHGVRAAPSDVAAGPAAGNPSRAAWPHLLGATCQVSRGNLTDLSDRSNDQ